MTTFMFINATVMFLVGAPVVGSLALLAGGVMAAVEALDDK